MKKAFSGSEGAAYYVYADDGGSLFLVKNLKQDTTPIELSNDFDYERMENEDVIFSPNGRYLAFLEKERGPENTLYLCDSRRPENIREIDRDIDQAWVLDNGKVLYTQRKIESYQGEEDGTETAEVSDYRLKYFDGRDCRNLDRGKFQFVIINEKQTYGYYLTDQGALYRLKLADEIEKERIDRDAGIPVNRSYLLSQAAAAAFDTFLDLIKQDVIIYSKPGDDEYNVVDIYAMLPGEDKKRLVQNVDDGIFGINWDGEGLSFYYGVDRSREVPLYDFVQDDKAEEDAEFLNSWNPDNDTGFGSVWDGSWVKNYEIWKATQNRETLRKQLKETTYYIKSSKIYRYNKGDIVQLIGDDMDYLDVSWPNPDYLLYRKAGEIEKVAWIEELSEPGDIYRYIALHKNMNPIEILFQGQVCDTKTDWEDIVGIYSFGEKNAVIWTRGGSRDKLTEYYMEDEENPKWEHVIAEGTIPNICVMPDENGEDVLYFWSDASNEIVDSSKNIDVFSGTLQRFSDGKRSKIDDEVNDACFIEKDGRSTVLYVKETEMDKSGRVYYTLYEAAGGKGELLGEDVISFCALDMDKILFLCDGGDIYLWDGKQTERIGSDGEKIWCSPSLDLDIFEEDDFV